MGTAEAEEQHRKSGTHPSHIHFEDAKITISESSKVGVFSVMLRGRPFSVCVFAPVLHVTGVTVP